MRHPKEAIFNQFQILGEFLKAESCDIGHINGTFASTFDQGGTKVRYIHQRINKAVFQNPPALMRNVVRVTNHIRHKLEAQGVAQITRRSLTLVPTRNGGFYHVDDTGDYWRTFLYLEGLKSFNAVETPQQAYEAARAFGMFQRLLVDLPGERLTDTIPDFHNSRKRFTALLAAIEEDACGRAGLAKAEIEFALKREAMVDVILAAMARNEIPERITHNDTKFNNVMFDSQTGEAMCVVDLDTVMPGCALYDFGDMVRTTTSPTEEDERDLSKIAMQMPMFQKLAEGYLSAAGEFLVPAERALIAFSGKLITFTIGLRFLTDYLKGDTYFRIHREGHNLDRCRTQFKLVESIEQQEDAMQKFADSL